MGAGVAALLAAHPPVTTDPRAFLQARWDRGLGLLDDPDDQAELEATLRAAGAADPFVGNPIGLGMVAPTIRRHGTDAQRERFVGSPEGLPARPGQHHRGRHLRGHAQHPWRARAGAPARTTTTLTRSTNQGDQR